MQKPKIKSSAKAEIKKATKVVKATIQEAKAIDVSKAAKKRTPTISLKQKVAEVKNVIFPIESRTEKPTYLPNELRPGSLISINNYKPNKKGHCTAQMYEVKEPAKDGIVTGLNINNPHIKIKAYSIIHNGVIKFPGLGRYTHVGFLINPNKK
jgi:hypothetical protein